MKWITGKRGNSLRGNKIDRGNVKQVKSNQVHVYHSGYKFNVK